MENLEVGTRIKYKQFIGTVTRITTPKCKCKGKNQYHIVVDQPSAVKTLTLLDRQLKDISIIGIEPNQNLPNFSFDNP
jgi:type I site-specific restriction endonuclease